MTDSRTADTRTAGTRTAAIRTAETTALPTVPHGSDRVVTVNGTTRPWVPALTVAALVAELLGDTDAAPGTSGTGASGSGTAGACAPTGVAVALDDTIVPRGLWASTPVPADARVEVVTAVQGG